MTISRFRLTAIVVASIAIAACAMTEISDNSVAGSSSFDGEFEFTDCSSYVADIAQSLDDESRALVKSTDYGDLVQFHHGWGTGIRNEGGLWAGNDELNLSCARLRGHDDRIHPDDVSMIVIEEVWKLLQRTDDA